MDMGGWMPREKWGNVLAVIAGGKTLPLAYPFLPAKGQETCKFGREWCPLTVVAVDYPK